MIGLGSDKDISNVYIRPVETFAVQLHYRTWWQSYCLKQKKRAQRVEVSVRENENWLSWWETGSNQRRRRMPRQLCWSLSTGAYKGKGWRLAPVPPQDAVVHPHHHAPLLSWSWTCPRWSGARQEARPQALLCVHDDHNVHLVRRHNGFSVWIIWPGVIIRLFRY